MVLEAAQLMLRWTAVGERCNDKRLHIRIFTELPRRVRIGKTTSTKYASNRSTKRYDQNIICCLNEPVSE